jgi:hypothetical protein
MMFFRRSGRKAVPRKARGVTPGLESLEGRQVLSAAHPLPAAALDLATAVEVAPMQAALAPAASRGVPPISMGSGGNPINVYQPPSPTNFLPGYQYYSVSGVKIPGDPFGRYSSFTVYGSSPSRGAYGVFGYFTQSEGYYNEYIYSIYTRNVYGSWGITLPNANPYYSNYAPDLYDSDPIH